MDVTTMLVCAIAVLFAAGITYQEIKKLRPVPAESGTKPLALDSEARAAHWEAQACMHELAGEPDLRDTCCELAAMARMGR